MMPNAFDPGSGWAAAAVWRRNFARFLLKLHASAQCFQNDSAAFLLLARSLAGTTWTPKAPTCPNMWVYQLWWRWDADLWRPSVPLANCDLPVRTALKLAQRWWDFKPTCLSCQWSHSVMFCYCIGFVFCFPFNLLPPAEWCLLGGLKQTLLPAGSLFDLITASKCKR